MGAAMEGGIGGHAGIFSNSMDVAKIMQLYLKKEIMEIDNISLKKHSVTLILVIFCAEGNRRGVGFDKPQLGDKGPTCGCASMTSFGHTGFTGTMAWRIRNEIVYIFYRTFPDSTNKLSRENIREDIQAIIYDAIEH
jgi:CubicO group peptidase (beta-lactamase class C family)